MTVTRRWLRISYLADAALAGALALEMEVQFGAAHSDVPGHVATAIAAALLGAAFATRTRWPVVALIGAASVMAAVSPFGTDMTSGDVTHRLGPVLVLVVVSYSAGAHLVARHSTAAVAIALLLLVGSALVLGVHPSWTDAAGIASTAFYTSLIVVPGWAVGRLAGRQDRTARRVGDWLARAQVDRERRETEATVQERARIASELQDVVAHSVSLMVVQAGGARMLLHADPERARESILEIERTGREVLADLRRLLGMLRKSDGPGTLEIQPGLSSLPRLIEEIGRAGVACRTTTEGMPVDLTPGVDLVAYRMAEGVLRAVAIGRPCEVQIKIAYLPQLLQVDLTGDAAVPDLTESVADAVSRVASYGGTMRQTRTVKDGFSIQIRLPISVGARP